MSASNSYTDYLLRHESTSCRAEQELIKRSLKSERHARLAMAVNLTSEKAHSEASRQYTRYKQASLILFKITDNDIYNR